MLDELVGKVENSGMGIPINDHLKVATLGYTDNLILMNDTYYKCQRYA